MKSFSKYFKNSSGFTLIELLVVIGILGVLSAVLITLVDPVDKINASNDTGALSTIRQLGEANDSYAANHNNLYVVATTFAGAVTALNTSGESKFATITAPTNYTYSYFAPAGCAAATPANCSSYVFYTTLRSKKYSGASPVITGYMYANGKGCTVTAAPTVSTATCP